MRVKPLVIILCLLQSLAVLGQKAPGEVFFGRHGYSTTTFTLSPDSSFRYEGTGCMVRDYGYGSFRFTNKKLNLYFVDSVRKYTIAPDTSCKYGEKIAIRFKVLDRETRLPLQYVNVSLKRDSIRSRVWITDSSGLVTMLVNRRDTTYLITVDPPGFWQKNFSISVNGAHCQDVLLRIAAGQNYYTDHGTIWEYKMLRNTRHKLILKEKGRNGVYYKRKMKRVKTIKISS